MSKQQQATKIFNSMSHLPRKIVLEEIVQKIGVSQAYASTLYANAKKNATGNVASQSSATSHVKPSAKQIEKFDRATLRQLREKLDSAVADVLEEMGLSGEIGNIRFSETHFTAKLEVGIGNPANVAYQQFEDHAWKFGLTGDHFGKTFTYAGEQFTVCGIKPKSKKYPIIAKNARGTEYKFPVHAVK